MSRSSIKDFEILVKLGSGSFGTVYKVRRLVDNKHYVIKNVKIVELSRREQAEAINEVQILAQLNSPYVVRYYDSFIDTNSLMIVMEFCNRGDLQNLLKKAKEKNVTCLKESVIWNIVLQIILGLQYIHHKHILHRDLKSANVFLTKDPNNPNYLVKIGDLGVAKLLDTSTALASTIVGTPYYLSPELCADKPYRDKSDCWALGVILYEHPFEARNQCALVMKIIQSPVTPPPATSVSDIMIQLVLWLLQKDPNRRPSIKDILSEDAIRKKLNEHHFELPAAEETARINQYLAEKSPSESDEAPRDTVILRFNEAGEIVNFVSKDVSLTAQGKDTRTVQGHNGGEIKTVNMGTGPVRAASPSPAAGPAATRTGAPLRGDRVRGGSKRVPSDKALTRYQVRPVGSSTQSGAGNHAAPSVTAAGNDYNSDYEGDWVADEKPGGLPGVADRKEQKGIALPDGERGGKETDEEATYEQEGFEAYDEAAEKDTEGNAHEDSKKDSLGMAFDGQSKLGLEESSSVDDSRRVMAPSSARTSDYDDLVDVERDHSGSDAKAAGAIELSSDTHFDFEPLLEGIREAKQQAISTLGEHVFLKVYDLCAKSMVQNDNDSNKSSFLEELEKTLSENACTDMEEACEAVFKVRVLLALESKYDSILMAASANDSIARK